VKVPEGAQTGKTVRLKGKGMPSLRSRDRGDMVVEFYVETPTGLDARQKALLRELEESLGAQQQPQHAGFFDKAKRFWDGLTGHEETRERA
jgi:molecular chaperone DnaJ